jgi:SAM-dependent methyltransferase
VPGAGRQRRDGQCGIGRPDSHGGGDTAVAIEASPAYLAAAAEEAARRRRSESISFVHGDFVNVGERLAVADVVTLDRVVCCYADYKSLLHEAIRHARRGLALSYPRDRWFRRLGVRLENTLHSVRSNPFRTFVHPVEAMQRLIGEAGLTLVNRNETLTWAADIYVRVIGLPIQNCPTLSTGALRDP